MINNNSTGFLGNRNNVCPSNISAPIIGEEVADLMEDLVESATMIDQLEQYTDLLVDLDVEAINEAGIKLYIDKDKNFTKVKYAFSQESMADVLEGVTFDEYSIVIVLDKNNVNLSTTSLSPHQTR